MFSQFRHPTKMLCPLSIRRFTSLANLPIHRVHRKHDVIEDPPCFAQVDGIPYLLGGKRFVLPTNQGFEGECKRIPHLLMVLWSLAELPKITSF